MKEERYMMQHERAYEGPKFDRYERKQHKKRFLKGLGMYAVYLRMHASNPEIVHQPVDFVVDGHMVRYLPTDHVKSLLWIGFVQ